MSESIHPKFRQSAVRNTRETSRKAFKALRHTQRMERYLATLSDEERRQALRNGVWSKEQLETLEKFNGK